MNMERPPVTPNEAPPASPRSSYTPFIVLLVLGAVLGVVIAIGAGPKVRMSEARAKAQEAANQPRSVYVEEARKKDGPVALTLPGSVIAWETAEIYSRTDGFVRQYKVDLGDRVKAGDVLAILDAPEIESQARSAEAKVKELEENERLSRTRAERYKRLAEAGVNSREQADQYEVEANTTVAALEASRAEVHRIRTLLGFRIVKAPFDGVVTRRSVEKGTLVTAGSTSGVTSLFEIARTEKLRVLIDVPQTLAPSVRVGDEAKVIFGQTTVTGQIARTAGALDPSTRTLRVEAVIPGDQGVLAGSFVRVSLSLTPTSPPVLVPANAIVPEAEGTVVFAVNGEGKIERRPVEIGRELGVDVEIVSGLVGGERIVKSPPESLREGDTVRAILEAPKEKR